MVPEMSERRGESRYLSHVTRSAVDEWPRALRRTYVRLMGIDGAMESRSTADVEDVAHLLVRCLRAEGVDCSSAEIIEGARNQIAFILIEARTGERTIIWDRDERLAYSVGEAPRDFARRGRVLHMDAHDPPACASVAREARAAGTVVSADVDNIYPGLDELLPLIDVLVSSREFPRRLTGIADERAALVEVKARDSQRVVRVFMGETAEK